MGSGIGAVHHPRKNVTCTIHVLSQCLLFFQPPRNPALRTRRKIGKWVYNDLNVKRSYKDKGYNQVEIIISLVIRRFTNRQRVCSFFAPLLSVPMISFPHPGSAYLSSLAFMSNARSIPGRGNSVVLDAKVYYCPLSECIAPFFTCSFHSFVVPSPHDVPPGL